jgi:hypothetical protein
MPTRQTPEQRVADSLSLQYCGLSLSEGAYPQAVVLVSKGQGCGARAALRLVGARVSDKSNLETQSRFEARVTQTDWHSFQKDVGLASGLLEGTNGGPLHRPGSLPGR